VAAGGIAATLTKAGRTRGPLTCGRRGSVQPRVHLFLHVPPAHVLGDEELAEILRAARRGIEGLGNEAFLEVRRLERFLDQAMEETYALPGRAGGGALNPS